VGAPGAGRPPPAAQACTGGSLPPFRISVRASNHRPPPPISPTFFDPSAPRASAPPCGAALCCCHVSPAHMFSPAATCPLPQVLLAPCPTPQGLRRASCSPLRAWTAAWSVHHSTVHCSAVQYSTLLYTAVQYPPVEYCTLQYPYRCIHSPCTVISTQLLYCAALFCAIVHCALNSSSLSAFLPVTLTQEPGAFVRLLLLGQSPSRWEWAPTGVCIFLGGTRPSRYAPVLPVPATSALRQRPGIC